MRQAPALPGLVSGQARAPDPVLRARRAVSYSAIETLRHFRQSYRHRLTRRKTSMSMQPELEPRSPYAVAGALGAQQQAVLRNTYLMLALTMVPTVIGAMVGMA